MNSHPELAPERPMDARTLEQLTDFAKEELAAALTYEKALTLPTLNRHADVLRRCYASHHNRVVELTQRIRDLGGQVPNSPGLWGSLLPTLASAAASVSESLAISLLEESEDRGNRRYREHLQALEPMTRAFLIERILPAQNASHAAMSDLKRLIQS
jgi:hypothetical protein